MVQFNTKDNEILIKVVYYGTGLSGKTTNLQKLHQMTDPDQATDLFSVNTMEDRTLFFDLLPVDLGQVFGNTIKLQIYTVPGQVHYDSTRRIVLSGADGVVFVADSDTKKLQENVQSINNLYHNLQANRLNIKEVPLVMQYNKRDLPDITPIEVLEQKLNFRKVPYFEAVAIEGKGVLETFVETVTQTVRYIFQKYQLTKAGKNVDSVIAKLRQSITANAAELEEVDTRKVQKNTGEITSKTVLKYEHVHGPDDEKASKEQLLQKAITSNMETAQLYTELKRHQEALVQKNKELKILNKKVEKSNSENLKIRRFLENLVNFAGEAILTFNELWTIQNWNQSAEDLFGYKRAEALGKNINMVFPDDTMTDLNRVLSYVMEGKVVRGFETRLKAKGGEVVPVNITFSPIKTQNKGIVAFTAIVRDLSFLNQISQQMHLMQRFESVGYLLPDLLELIRKQWNGPSQFAELLTLMGEISESSSGNKEKCNINDLIQQVYKLLEHHFHQKRVVWNAQLFPGLPQVKVDQPSVMRALLNFFLNGLDALEDKTNGKFTVGTHHTKDEVLVQIIDNGVGMTHDELDRMIDPSMDTRKNLRNIRLNASRDIVKDNNGTVRVDTTPGKGTKVTVRFRQS